MNPNSYKQVMLWHMHIHLSSFSEGENNDNEKNVSGSCVIRLFNLTGFVS